ncbi:hypothetical protein ACKLNR_013168 [Fusarium oxysporum f. sp. zingiberi]
MPQFISRCRHEALCLGWRSTQPDCDWDSPDIAHVLATVTPLNTNISTRAFAFRERGDDWREVGDTDWLERVTDWTAPQIRAEAENESNFTGLARLVQKCPRLQDFAYQALGIPFPVFLS